MGLLQMLGLQDRNPVVPGYGSADRSLVQRTPPIDDETAGAGGLGAILGPPQRRPIRNVGDWAMGMLPVLQRFGTGLAMGRGIPGAIGFMQQSANDDIDRRIKLATLAKREGPTEAFRTFQEYHSLPQEQQREWLNYRNAGAPKFVTGNDGAVYQIPTNGMTGAPVTKKLSNGQTAYWVNGDWYDNPEGK